MITVDDLVLGGKVTREETESLICTAESGDAKIGDFLCLHFSKVL